MKIRLNFKIGTKFKKFESNVRIMKNTKVLFTIVLNLLVFIQNVI